MVDANTQGLEYITKALNDDFNRPAYREIVTADKSNLGSRLLQEERN